MFLVKSIAGGRLRRHNNAGDIVVSICACKRLSVTPSVSTSHHSHHGNIAPIRDGPLLDYQGEQFRTDRVIYPV